MSPSIPRPHPGLLDVTGLTETFSTRLLLVSPPRVGSTPVARLLWEHPVVSHHCHEPFEAVYWGSAGLDSIGRCLLGPMNVATGEREPARHARDPRGLLIKEMSFQLDMDSFRWLCALTDRPVIFVIRSPRAAVVSRLRIVRELSGAETFPPDQSGWPALGEQTRACSEAGIPYLVVDSDDLRADPVGNSYALVAALGLTPAADLVNWRPRQDLRLCTPDVGALMGDVRSHDDPFYRRVLASDGIQPPDSTDGDVDQAVVNAAGLAEDVAKWDELYGLLRAGGRLVRADAPATE